MYFDYGAAAELFARQRTKIRQRTSAVTHMKFVAAAEAIRYAVEEIPPSSFRESILEVNEERLELRRNTPTV